jgi:hypothetical protein
LAITAAYARARVSVTDFGACSATLPSFFMRPSNALGVRARSANGDHAGFDLTPARVAVPWRCVVITLRGALVGEPELEIAR